MTSAWRPGGWYEPARAVASPNFGPRTGSLVELVIVHSISLPPGRYGGDAIERLFTNRLDDVADLHPGLARLRGTRVSAHFLIRRDGGLLQFVGCDDKAWHAGESQWHGRPACNDYSVGIELEGLEGLCFESRQYDVLADLLRALAGRYPIQGIAGHEHVAAGRKHDPGAGFDWERLRKMTGWSAPYFPEGAAAADWP
ncbi:MAG TPA: 1,6-anhydro-N-acetylmuramyl-L-alanine amidase AmpD [Burkholderiaceae bacterium]|nr:1,6-anhydro-N-acetylmuramyl-L-alanine amidase AmpD [Burkholderiaceae bacterium]